jgi:signal transduction histidine kinase
MSEAGLSTQRSLAVDPDQQGQAEWEFRLVAEVGEVLATTLDFEDTLTKIAQLVVSNFADLCVINFIDDDGVPRRARVFCRNAAKAWVCEALMRMPPGREQVRIAQSVLELGKPALITDVTPDHLRSWAASDEQFAALEAIDPKSAIIAPLLVHGRLLGTLTLISSDASRPYGPDDLRIAEAIAGRSAFFLENARHYRDTKRATEMRDDVLRIVVHDLRNPLAVISACASVLRRQNGESEVIDEVQNAVKRMSRLIQDLMDVTRLRSGNLPLQPDRIDAVEIASATLESQKRIASSASVEIRLESAPDLPTIWADRDRLLQVFENLVSNAIKFTEPGGKVTVSVAEGKDEVLFSVADTGRGIASDQLAHVFELFWQAPGAVRRGTGMGLPIAKGIVEAHGGRIWIESSPGHGSTFFFAIPEAPPEQMHNTLPPRGSSKIVSLIH